MDQLPLQGPGGGPLPRAPGQLRGTHGPNPLAEGLAELTNSSGCAGHLLRALRCRSLSARGAHELARGSAYTRFCKHEYTLSTPHTGSAPAFSTWFSLGSVPQGPLKPLLTATIYLPSFLTGVAGPTCSDSTF